MYLFLYSDKDKQAFEAWHAHDDAEDNFCELDGEWESPIYSSSVAHAESDRCGGRPNSQRRDTEWTIQLKGCFWIQMEYLARDRGDWRSFVDGLCSEME